MRIIVVDLEATCDEVETDAISGPNREMIELGALKFDLETGGTVDTFQSFVRPQVNPILTDFCKQLLNIDQSSVDSAEPFPAVDRAFRHWAGDDAIAWASWGNFDVHQWHHDATRYELNPDLPWQHINLKKAFGKAMGMRRCGIGGAYAKLGLDIGDERHRALADARLVAKLLDQLPTFREYVRKACVDTGEEH